MNLYEEFGLPSTATAAELSKAHKAWARLLHPDKVRDDVARGLAESRMKRINEIYTILSDPEQRARYDESLAPPLPAVVCAIKPPRDGREITWLDIARHNAAWGAATVICVAAIYWTLSSHSGGSAITASSPANTPFAPPQAAAVKEAPPSEKSRIRATQPGPRWPDRARTGGSDGDVQLLAREMNEMRRRLDAALLERDRARAPDQAAETSPPPPVLAPPDLSSIAPPGPLRMAPVAPPPSPLGLAGTWVYMRPPSGGTGDDYPAEYIELVVVEKGDALAGRYRGRYRVPDRALSPEVRFTFQGPRGGKLDWTGNSGARGEVELKLVGEHTVSVTWYTSEFGQQPSLTSGAATLIRRFDP